MSSFDILSKETVLPRRFFLEASAGTGKTFAIEHMVIRLLLETEMTLDQILVVTFTKAATRDLKERIYANIQKIVEGGSFDYCKGIGDNLVEKIRFSFRSFERASIFTIHGFCYKILQEFAFEASVGFDLQEWSFEEERWEILEFLRTCSIITAQQLKRVFGFCQNDIEVLVEKIMKNSSQQGRGFVEVLQNLNKSIADIPIFLVSSVFEKIRVNYKGMGASWFTDQALMMDRALARKEFLVEELDWLIGQDSIFLENLDESNAKLRKKSSFCSLELENLRRHIYPIIEEARSCRKILFALSCSWQKKKQELSRKYDKIFPEDLLLLIQRKVQDPVFVELVRKKYQAIIIDEFQDTDPIQWDIFHTLFVQHKEKFVYLIGDPKQSIYGFRNADIYTFFEAKKQFPHQGTLTINFRSKPKLIAALNRLMAHQSWINLPALQSYMTVSPVFPSNPEEDGGALCFMIASGTIGRGQRWPTFSMENDSIFPFIVKEISSLQCCLEDVCILVKDRYQALRIKEYFSLHGVAATIAKVPPLKNSLALEVIREVILACYGDQKNSFIKRFLLGPLVQIPMEKLTTEVLVKTHNTIETLVQIWENKGIGCFFVEFLQTVFWKKTVESSAIATGVYEDMVIILQKIIFCQDFRQALLVLKKIKETEGSDRGCSHRGGVSIMTTHASKGLEFDTVFALGVASRGVEEDGENGAEIDAEKMRQLYVALTRAKIRLYIPFLIETTKENSKLSSPLEIFAKRVSLNPYEFDHVHLT